MSFVARDYDRLIAANFGNENVTPIKCHYTIAAATAFVKDKLFSAFSRSARPATYDDYLRAAIIKQNFWNNINATTNEAGIQTIVATKQKYRTPEVGFTHKLTINPDSRSKIEKYQHGQCGLRAPMYIRTLINCNDALQPHKETEIDKAIARRKAEVDINGTDVTVEYMDENNESVRVGHSFKLALVSGKTINSADELQAFINAAPEVQEIETGLRLKF